MTAAPSLLPHPVVPGHRCSEAALRRGLPQPGCTGLPLHWGLHYGGWLHALPSTQMMSPQQHHACVAAIVRIAIHLKCNIIDNRMLFLDNTIFLH